jgi:hypothetical protein
MANYESIMRLRPEVREFVRNRRWVHRGDVLFYGANTKGEHFSTDQNGFRHSVFKGKTISSKDVVDYPRYGLILGPSNVYGFGLSGNENTMGSVLAEQFGFPFLNAGLPEGNSRNLFSLLLAILGRGRAKPAVVLHLSGGDFTSFCYTSIADPIFGPPNLKQISEVIKERGGKLPPAKQQMPALLAFTSTWIQAMGRLCKQAGVPFVLGEDVTFFEKAKANEIEVKSGLGEGKTKAQERQFQTHKDYVRTYHDRRQALAKSLGVPLPGPSFGNDIGFVDEFHYDKQGTRDLCDYFGRGIESVLR